MKPYWLWHLAWACVILGAGYLGREVAGNAGALLAFIVVGLLVGNARMGFRIEELMEEGK